LLSSIAYLREGHFLRQDRHAQPPAAAREVDWRYNAGPAQVLPASCLPRDAGAWRRLTAISAERTWIPSQQREGIPALIGVSPQTSLSAAAALGALWRKDAAYRDACRGEGRLFRSRYGAIQRRGQSQYQLLLQTMDLGYETVIYADCDIAFGDVSTDTQS